MREELFQKEIGGEIEQIIPIIEISFPQKELYLYGEKPILKSLETFNTKIPYTKECKLCELTDKTIKTIKELLKKLLDYISNK